MPFSIRPFRRFPVCCPVTYHAGLFEGQAYGHKAEEAASAFGKEMTLQTYGKNKYGRTIADVFLPDGTNVNHTLVKDGWRVSHDKRVECLTGSHDPSRLEPLTLPDLGS